MNHIQVISRDNSNHLSRQAKLPIVNRVGGILGLSSNELYGVSSEDALWHHRQEKLRESIPIHYSGAILIEELEHPLLA